MIFFLIKNNLIHLVYVSSQSYKFNLLTYSFKIYYIHIYILVIVFLVIATNFYNYSVCILNIYIHTYI